MKIASEGSVPDGARWGGPAAALGACALTTLLGLPLAGRIDPANIMLLYVLAVVLVAVRAGRAPGILAAILAVGCFDYFFVPPRGSFTVDQPQYLLTFALMLGVSLLVGRLTHALGEKAREAERRAAEAAALHALASELAGALTLDAAAERLDRVLGLHLGLGATLYLPDDDGVHLHPASTDAAHADYVERLVANGVFASGAVLHATPDLEDGALTVLVPLPGGTRSRGVMALHAPRERVAPPSARLATAIAALAATVIERLHFVEVAQASALAMQDERLRNSILSALSHDLRTPLTVLYGFADALACREDLNPEARAAALEMGDQSRRLHAMVDNLLDLARLRSGAVVLRRDWQSLPDLLGACLQSARPWLGTREVTLDIPVGLPLVQLDATLFERVLHNLLENAGKYATPGTPIAIAATRAGDELLVTVRNAGPGLPPDGEDLFALFVRGPRDQGAPGVGVGLAVCRAIVEAHGGRIGARDVTAGCEVCVHLPLAPPPAGPDDGGSDA